MSISQTTKLSYGIGALGKDLACSIIYLYLMFYYTDVVGLSAAFVGSLFLFARIWDAVTDPIMGLIVDNTRTRWGKFRPWILIGTIINSLVMIAVFLNHELEGVWLYVYASVSYVLWGMTYTIMDIPYWSIIPSLTSDKTEREKIVVVPRLFASVAWLIMGAFGLKAIDWLGDGETAVGFVRVSIAIAIFFIISALVTVINVKDVVDVKVRKEKIKLKDVMVIIGQNDQLKALIGIVLSFNMAMQLAGGFAIYYFTYAIGNKDLFPVFMMLSGAAEIAGLVLFPKLAQKVSRPMVWKLACLFPLLSCGVLLFSGIFMPESHVLVGISGAALKFGSGFALAMSTVMLADVVDYGEYKMGIRSESVIFSVQTMLVKGASAIAGFLIGLGLALTGYVPNEVQDESTIMGMRLLMIGIPFLLVCLSYLIYRKYYKLNGDFHDNVLRELNKSAEGVPQTAK
ncbi:melibiose:sodium transporter MelB [Mixta sp. Marseille-Q2659]|uniref:melibiose:sodium transporter MelB n=1 Tax=Mixta sp. Marseille-Q2659 TaxID=2736607 RepID=UPI0023B91D9D|nr:melibiose:sodium transporter MelB [Mixta sp. Marseille-Q2659]